MMKIWFFIAFLIIAFCDSHSSTDIECSFIVGGFIISNPIYYCNVVNNDPNILTPESAENFTISGQHKNVNTNYDVIGFYVGFKTIKFFPRGLIQHFKKLQRIYINICKLEEIHQSDLKPFTLLTHFYIIDNINVIEEGLFDYNPNLEWVGFSGSNIIHIDPNVFDNLKKLKTFWLETVPCVMKKVDNSHEKVKEAIVVVKRQCRNSEFMEIEDKMKNLESESKTLNIGEFNEKLELFEKSFITSKFSKYRPLNYKLENLKKTQSSSSSEPISSNLQSEQLLDQKVCPKADYPTDMLKNISDLFKDLKSTQCGITDPFLNINMSMTTITSKINDLTVSQDQLKIFQNNAASSIDVKLNSLKDSQKSALDGIKESISDMEATLSNVKTSQNDFKSSLSKIKTSQNEIRIALDELKGSQGENSGDELTEIREKLEGLEGHFQNFEVKNAEKFEKLEKELVNSHHKMEIKLDEKIKGIEKRIVKKFEEILEEKLAKILEDKLNVILNSKLGTQ